MGGREGGKGVPRTILPSIRQSYYTPPPHLKESTLFSEKTHTKQKTVFSSCPACGPSCGLGFRVSGLGVRGLGCRVRETIGPGSGRKNGKLNGMVGLGSGQYGGSPCRIPEPLNPKP